MYCNWIHYKVGVIIIRIVYIIYALRFNFFVVVIVFFFLLSEFIQIDCTILYIPATLRSAAGAYSIRIIRIYYTCYNNAGTAMTWPYVPTCTHTSPTVILPPVIYSYMYIINIYFNVYVLRAPAYYCPSALGRRVTGSSCPNEFLNVCFLR